MWPLRRAFWNRLAVLKFSANRPAVIPVPQDDGLTLRPVSLASQFPGIPIPNITVADAVPADEASRLKRYFYELQVAMYRWLSPMQPGLPSIDADPAKALDEAYTAAHRRRLAAPVLPPEYQGAIDLGSVAVAGPYACYVERAAEGGYQWDLTRLARYEHHDGLHPLGVRVLFRVDHGARCLRPEHIEWAQGRSTPGDAGWELARKIALCAVTTHVSLVRHFNWVHLAAGGPLALATRNCLPASHPLRRLVWPHMFGTQYSNQIVTKGQMVRGGDFEATFSFTHAGMCKLFEDSYDEFDIRVLDPARDAERRGIEDAGFDTPALVNRQAHFDVMHEHALGYLRLYYGSDAALCGDARVVDWVGTLDRLVPNGVRTLLERELTIPGLARLVAAFIYMASVEHEVLGTGLWNYQMWTQVQPARVYTDGRRQPLDVYQRLVNANFNLNVHRAGLVQDFGYLALDAKGAEAFRRFKDALRRLQARLEQEPFAYWKMYPEKLEANINA